MIVALALLPDTETSRAWFKNMQLIKRDRGREKVYVVVTLLLKILHRIRIYNLRDNPPGSVSMKLSPRKWSSQSDMTIKLPEYMVVIHS